MSLLGNSVCHIRYGKGKITEITDDRIKIAFSSGEKLFEYPFAFDRSLTLDSTELQAEVMSLLKKAKKEKSRRKEEKRNKEIAAREARKQKDLELKKSSAKKTKAAKLVVKKNAEIYFVFQNKNFEDEFNNKFLWAPILSPGGKTAKHHWKRLTELKKGNVILHGVSGNIVAISTVTAPYIESPRPSTQPENDIEIMGMKVECDYTLLKNPLAFAKYKEEIIKTNSETTYPPFNKNGMGNQGYLYNISANLALFFIKEIVSNNPELAQADFIAKLLK